VKPFWSGFLWSRSFLSSSSWTRVLRVDCMALCQTLHILSLSASRVSPLPC
jgi:hypothetical protein